MRIELPSCDDFYLVMYRDLCKRFSIAPNDNNELSMAFLTGTIAWGDAFHIACDKIKVPELWDDYNNLDWSDADLADEDILNRMICAWRKEYGGE